MYWFYSMLKKEIEFNQNYEEMSKKVVDLLANLEEEVNGFVEFLRETARVGGWNQEEKDIIRKLAKEIAFFRDCCNTFQRRIKKIGGGQ